jgi:hypothetical protein
MSFRASIANPFNPEFTELGPLTPAQIINTFASTPWNNLIAQIAASNNREIFHSPSLEVENTSNKNSLCLSAIDEQEWLIFYKRPKLIVKRSLFGKKEVMDENYMSEKTVQGVDEALRCLQALLDGRLDMLEQLFES